MRPISTQQEAQRGMPKRFLAQGVAILGMSLALGACNNVDTMTTSSIPMDDYRVRHPIALSETSNTLDIFPAPQSGSLDSRSAGQVVEFGRRYRQFGEGPIIILYPAGPGVLGHASVDAIRRALALGGAHGDVRVGSYPVTQSAIGVAGSIAFHRAQGESRDAMRRMAERSCLGQHGAGLG